MNECPLSVSLLVYPGNGMIMRILRELHFGNEFDRLINEVAGPTCDVRRRTWPHDIATATSGIRIIPS